MFSSPVPRKNASLLKKRRQMWTTSVSKVSSDMSTSITGLATESHAGDDLVEGCNWL